MPIITNERILDYKVPYSEDIAKKFNTINIKEIICKNIQESQILIDIRDWLLPMLMNGQISILDN